MVVLPRAGFQPYSSAIQKHVPLTSGRNVNSRRQNRSVVHSVHTRQGTGTIEDLRQQAWTVFRRVHHNENRSGKVPWQRGQYCLEHLDSAHRCADNENVSSGHDKAWMPRTNGGMANGCRFRTISGRASSPQRKDPELDGSSGSVIPRPCGLPFSRSTRCLTGDATSGASSKTARGYVVAT
jgi:hypothetical protein